MLLSHVPTKHPRKGAVGTGMRPCLPENGRFPVTPDHGPWRLHDADKVVLIDGVIYRRATALQLNVDRGFGGVADGRLGATLACRIRERFSVERSVERATCELNVLRIPGSAIFFEAAHDLRLDLAAGFRCAQALS